MKKEVYNKRLKLLFKKTGVRKIDLHSKEVFSYATEKDYIKDYKKKMSFAVSMFTLSFILQIVALTNNYLVPEPRFFITTFNGHVYEISKPVGSLDGAVAINKKIEGRKRILSSEAE